MILVNPQWQGGGEPSTYFGAKAIEALYLKGKRPYESVPVTQKAALAKDKGIVGRKALMRQFQAAHEILRKNHPRRLLTIGGGCDADMASLAYLNARYQNDLTVLWLDAHGDMNAPEESETGLLYGMPARLLMAPSHGFEAWLDAPIAPGQWVQIGGRDFDAAEEVFMRRQAIDWVPAAATTPERIAAILKKKGHAHVYVHLDLDVLDPKVFRQTPLPVAGGLSARSLMQILDVVEHAGDWVGLGLFECQAEGAGDPLIADVLQSDALSAIVAAF
jgi:arginase